LSKKRIFYKPPKFDKILTSTPVPSQPLDVSFRNVTSTSVDVSWSQPDEVNGVIVGYRLYYMHNNFTDVVTIHASTPQMQHTLSSLSKAPLQISKLEVSALPVFLNGPQ
jgi:hypothetical protein